MSLKKLMKWLRENAASVMVAMVVAMTGLGMISSLMGMAHPVSIPPATNQASTALPADELPPVNAEEDADATAEAELAGDLAATAPEPGTAELYAAVPGLPASAVYDKCKSRTIQPPLDGKVAASSEVCVYEAARLLKATGYYLGTVKATAYRGKATYTPYTAGFSLGNAILRYQQANGLTADAKMGPATWRKLTSPVQVRPSGLPLDCRSAVVTICVSIPQQTMYVKYMGKLYTSPVTTAGVSTLGGGAQADIPHLWWTTTGTLSVQQKLDNPYSQRWESNMPHSLVLTPAVYIHEYSHVGWLYGSHGCIRVPKAFQDWLWFITPVGTRVRVSMSLR